MMMYKTAPRGPKDTHTKKIRLNNKMKYDWVLTVSTLCSYAVLEFLWLSLMTNRFYMPRLMPIQPYVTPKTFRVDKLAAVLAYVAVAAVIYIFIIHDLATGNERRSDKTGFTMEGLLRAAVLGFAVYGVYNFTCKAVFVRYGWSMVVVDTLWGISIFSVVYVIAALLSSRDRT